MTGVCPAFQLRDGPVLNVDRAFGSGMPVILQHGLCGDARQTAEVFPDDLRFQRITVEMRGHGRSHAGDLRQFSIKTFAADLAAYIEAHHTAPIVVGGISMGAAIALRLAVHQPDLVRGLILARPAWTTDASPANMSPNAEVGRLLAGTDPDMARQTFLESETARRLAEVAPDNLASLLGFFQRQPLSETSALLTAISADGPRVTRRDLARLTIPTLIIGHEGDAIHPIAHAHSLASDIPGARLVEITPKAADRAAYGSDFRSALSHFLEDFL